MGSDCSGRCDQKSQEIRRGSVCVSVAKSNGALIRNGSHFFSRPLYCSIYLFVYRSVFLAHCVSAEESRNKSVCVGGGAK